MSEIILIAIGILSIAGIWYVYRKGDNDEKLKKTITVLLAAIIVMCTAFMLFDAPTRDIALFTGENSGLTLAQMACWDSNGYNPYVVDSWGGTDPDDDFDRDGIKNMWDQDADNDHVADCHEPIVRFNPYEPNYGINRMEIKWLSNSSISVRCTPVERTTAYESQATIYLNDVMGETKDFDGEVTFGLNIDPDYFNTIEVKVDGTQSDYANTADDYRSYTIPPAIFGIFGRWYADAELEVQGIIRNNPLFQSDGPLSFIDNVLRDTLAGIPLIFWIILMAIIVLIALMLFIKQRRIKKGKPPFMSWGRKKPKRYAPGDKVIKFY